MSLTKIAMSNFRSYLEGEYTFDSKLTLITGKNGTGKTNLLEAIYVLYVGSSFRVSDAELLSYGAEWWRIKGELEDDQREVRYQLHKKPTKQLLIHESTKRFMFKDRLPVVLFEPNDLLFVHGSPSRRRGVVDSMANNVFTAYKQTLARYDRALMQRNNLLKKQRNQPGVSELVFVWDVALANYGNEIIRMRSELVDHINQTLPYFYEQISREQTTVRLCYEPSLPFSTSSAYIASLQKHLEHDIVSSNTTKGPHRDSFSLLLAGQDAKQSASRGEIRSLILSMKFAQAAVYERLFGVHPLLLFDDVLSELDSQRKARLLELCANSQVVITDTSVHKELKGKHIKL